MTGQGKALGGEKSHKTLRNLDFLFFMRILEVNTENSDWQCALKVKEEFKGDLSNNSD